MSINKGRLNRLEDRYGGRECSTCGFDGDWSKMKPNVRWAHEVEDEPDGPTHCSECGRVLRIKLTWEALNG